MNNFISNRNVYTPDTCKTANGKMGGSLSEVAEVTLGATVVREAVKKTEPDLDDVDYVDMQDLYIIGAGGFGREVAWLVERINEVKPTWNLKGFIDDDESRWGSFEDEYPVLGGSRYLEGLGDVYAVCAVGSAAVRRQIIEKLKGASVQFATLIDPSVLISKHVKVGEGTIICAGTIITVDVEIGSHVIINLDCTIGHDDRIHDYVTIYPSVNVSGKVELGECCEIGTGAQIIQGKTVASQTIIGAGAVVIRNIEEPGTYLGIPARRRI